MVVVLSPVAVPAGSGAGSSAKQGVNRPPNITVASSSTAYRENSDHRNRLTAACAVVPAFPYSISSS